MDTPPGPAPRKFDRPVFRVLRATLIALALSGPLLLSGVLDEVYWRVLDTAPLAPPRSPRPHEIALPTSPFLEAGRRPDGSLDPWQLEARLRAAGLSEKQGIDVARHLLDLSPVVMGVADPALETQLRAEASAAARYLQATYPAAHAALESNIAMPSTRAPWQEFHVELLTQGYAFQPQPTPPLDPAGMAAARAALVAATGRAGLRALRVPLSSYTSPQSIDGLAVRIQAANNALQRATGWTGGVLGLDGRVEMRVGVFDWGVDDGKTMVSRRTGRIQVVGPTSALTHEWFHALDLLVARQAIAVPSPETLSTQLEPLRIVKDKTLARAWQRARQQVEASAPQWMWARRREALESGSIYWVSRSEGMAFAFQAHVAAQSPMLPLPSSIERLTALHPYAYPSPRERLAQARAWTTLFASISPLGRAPAQ